MTPTVPLFVGLSCQAARIGGREDFDQWSHIQTSFYQKCFGHFILAYELIVSHVLQSPVAGATCCSSGLWRNPPSTVVSRVAVVLDLTDVIDNVATLHDLCEALQTINVPHDCHRLEQLSLYERCEGFAAAPNVLQVRVVGTRKDVEEQLVGQSWGAER
jgi:hypothetical protein